MRRFWRYFWSWLKHTADTAPGAYMWQDDPKARIRNTTRANPPSRRY